MTAVNHQEGCKLPPLLLLAARVFSFFFFVLCFFQRGKGVCRVWQKGVVTGRTVYATVALLVLFRLLYSFCGMRVVPLYDVGCRLPREGGQPRRKKQSCCSPSP